MSNSTHISIASEHSKNVQLLLENQAFKMSKKDGIWEYNLLNPPKSFVYSFLLDGQEIADPYAKFLYSPTKSIYGDVPYFDFQGVKKPNIPIENTIIYELHTKAFTQISGDGTFKALIDKVPYLQSLGITAIELLPIFSFDPQTGGFWGYAPNHFFCPMSSYGCINSFKELVREFHRAGIEVILDVVYNHTGGLSLPSTPEYYLLSEGHHTNYSGCGNTLNCNTPTMQKLILSSLIYWANEVQVDGFRFDLASILTRGTDSKEMQHPPLIEAICSHPDLKGVKLIAEPWDPGGLYQLGKFPSNGRFLEWNGAFRDCIRSFLRGDGYPYQTIANSSKTMVNFVTSHDGFRLRDLVSYNEKHNEANGEDNRDGDAHNQSMNFGIEGETSDPEVNKLRKQQQKNFLLLTLLSPGTPMIGMGDEIGHSSKGNNNPWCQDNELNWINWSKADDELLQFTKKLIQIRKQHDLHSPKKVQEEQNLVIFCYLDKLLVACNSSNQTKKVDLDGWEIQLSTSKIAQNNELPPHSSFIAVATK